ncbi:MAG: folylpolyglutamate synthase/dihydrofolate synthase family protein [Actinomycetota bacterium]|nr:folylpolyglutamate synthase/dihydrofolate synthase family protein [Actinomycetota bacterium]MDK1026685.1 folylpolyglutamate synthase/dihydrofolate synthase family protein [Actinomycetota bacterium]
MERTANMSTIKNRDQAEAFLNARIGHGIKPGLSRITGLLEFMGNPQTTYPSIHIAGTNGKTTVSRMVQQILGAHGLATGGFTSPHLHTVEERFTLHGVTLDSTDFTDAVADIAWFVTAYEREADTSVTYFEVTAALAFSIFSTATVDVAVVEVGLGGRLDATNVIDSTVAVITGIDIDHIEFLGPTKAHIAAEKVGILGAGGLLVTGPVEGDVADVIGAKVAETASSWIRSGSDFTVTDAVVAVGGWHVSIDGVFGEYEELYLPMHGRHQVDHLATAVAACEMFLGRDLDQDSIATAVESMNSPGRLEIVNRRPLIMIDGAHNIQGFLGLAETLANEFLAIEWRLVLGMRGERDVGDLVSPLRGLIGKVFATAPADAAAIAPQEVAEAAGESLQVEAVVFADPAEAVDAAQREAGADGGVVVAGSLYLVGEVRTRYVTVGDRSGEAHLRFEAERDDGDDEADLEIPD